MELFLPPETNMSGNVNLDMRYSLPLEARGMTGTMSLTDGGVEQGSIGLTLKDLNFRSVFEGTVRRLEAQPHRRETRSTHLCHLKRMSQAHLMILF